MPLIDQNLAENDRKLTAYSRDKWAFRQSWAFRPQSANQERRPFLLAVPLCPNGIESNCSAHHWARALSGLSHMVWPMVPQFVKLYVKSEKNRANDEIAPREARRREVSDEGNFVLGTA